MKIRLKNKHKCLLRPNFAACTYFPTRSRVAFLETENERITLALQLHCPLTCTHIFIRISAFVGL